MAAAEMIRAVAGILLRSFATRDNGGTSCESFISVSCRSHANSLRRGASLKNIAIKKPQIRVVAKSTFFMVRVDLEKLWVSASRSIALRVPIGWPVKSRAESPRKFRLPNCLGKSDSGATGQSDGGSIELITSLWRARDLKHDALGRCPIPHRGGMTTRDQKAFQKISFGGQRIIAFGTRFFSTKFGKSIILSASRYQRAAPDSRTSGRRVAVICKH